MEIITPENLLPLTSTPETFPLIPIHHPNTDGEDETYYRSKLFTPTSGINPITMAAQPLYALMDRLKNATEVQNINKIQRDIEHELRAFRSQISGNTYGEETLGVATLFLVLTLHDCLGQTPWGKTISMGSFYPKNRQISSPKDEKIFTLIQQLLKHPHQNIEVLEHIYLCFSSGFEGPTKENPQLKYSRPNLLHNLYHAIRKVRGDFQYHFVPAHAKNLTLTSGNALKKKSFSFVLISGLLLLTLAISIILPWGDFQKSKINVKPSTPSQPAPIVLKD